MDAPTFDAIAPARPDLEDLGRRADATVTALADAGSTDAAVAALREWDGVRRAVSTFAAHVGLRFQQDTRDAGRRVARERWDADAPHWTALEIRVQRALLDHSRRAELEAAVGAQAFALWEAEALAFDPAIVDDLGREAQLEAEYTALLAGAEIEFRGETESLSTITRWREDADRAVRHGAERALWGWFGAHAEPLDALYGGLVELRHGMARKLGAEDFIPIAYKRMGRVDYDQTDVERFRESIRRDVVPLATELRARQARGLGLDRLMAWDEFVHDAAGNPAPRGDRPWMVERARRMFDAMGPELGGFFRSMDAGGFLDLDSRKGKAGGGFCTSFPTHGMPFVFANFNGSKGDVEVLTHEIGHAFQNFASREQWPTDYLWPTYDAAEIHSMGLEFLTWPHMELFFGREAERFRRLHLIEALLFMPYGTAVDHFQHEVFANPSLTPAERHALWLELERTYLPWRDWGDLEYPARGGRWQLQRHVYLSPFYYIDYVLAQTCALQLWARAEADRADAMGAYLELCTRGGSLPFQSLVRSAGLISPFDEGCLSDVVERARRTLDT